MPKKEYPKFLNSKLYLIEHLVTPVLLKKSSTNSELKNTLKQVQELLYASPQKIFSIIESKHTKVEETTQWQKQPERNQK